MKRRADGYRQFLNGFTEKCTRERRMDIDQNVGSFEAKNSFLYQLLKVSDNGRKYSQEEINDHIGTVVVAVSF